MIRKLVMLGLLVSFLSVGTLAVAEEVVLSSKGSKYHKEICRLIKNKDNTRKIEKEQAVEDGYDPCKRCYKEDVVVADENSEK